MRGSFDTGVLRSLAVPPALLSTVRAIGEHKGRQELYKRTAPSVLETLREVAQVQSVESSNRIEGITAPPDRIEKLVRQKSSPENRSEAEIAGYRDVLATIHTNAEAIHLTTGVILQLHRDLCKYASDPGGHWKTSDNSIEEVLLDGTRRLRFQPVPAFQTADAMQDLDRALAREWDGEVDHLLLVAAFTLDFLCVHPFNDGNGRMSRLLTLLLLYHAGYEVGRYVSLEKLVEDSKETYYDALQASSTGWHEGRHDLLPWIEYFSGVLLAAYREFESRVGAVNGAQGAKRQMVIDCVMRLPDEFRVGDIERTCPHISRPTINRVLRDMRRDDQLLCVKRGRDAMWRKVEGRGATTD